jgi:voltage-gated potassium channel
MGEDRKARRAKVKREIRTYRPLQMMFLWDIIQDRDSRPVLIWAVGTLLFGTFVYHWLEGWSYLDALYFCVISSATIGYGDLTPTTDLAKMFTIVYVVNSIVVLLALFDRIRSVRVQRMQKVEQDQNGP